MNLKELILKYNAQTSTQKSNKEQVLSQIKNSPDTILYRENMVAHITSSAIILNPAMTHTLMVHHNIYKTYCWTGGHADGNSNLLEVAIQESIQETGVSTVYPITDAILSIDLLPVKVHIKNEKEVAEHLHLSVAYGLIACENQPVIPKIDENSTVKWIPIDELEVDCEEKEMIVIYQEIIGQMKQEKEKNNAAILKEIITPLLAWYDKNARILPWRKDTNAYRVWISEIMLQQTRVEAVIPYFERFLDALPTIEELANAPESLLLKLWEGLGYYTRVRNLQKAAQMIVDKFHGKFPCDYDDILSLPGIGDYTAGAISSISFSKPTPAVDGNVMRVIARLTENFIDIASAKAKRNIYNALKQCYPTIRSGDFTQSLMELGATVCIPNGIPKCDVCPIAAWCCAYQHNTMMQLPIKTAKKPRRKESKTVFLLCFENEIAICKRQQKGVLSGMWEFFNVDETQNLEDAYKVLQDYDIDVVAIEPSISTKHIFTHIEWQMTSYIVTCRTKHADFVWVNEQIFTKEIALPSAFKPFYTVWCSWIETN